MFPRRPCFSKWPPHHHNTTHLLSTASHSNQSFSTIQLGFDVTQTWWKKKVTELVIVPCRWSWTLHNNQTSCLNLPRIDQDNQSTFCIIQIHHLLNDKEVKNHTILNHVSCCNWHISAVTFEAMTDFLFSAQLKALSELITSKISSAVLCSMTNDQRKYITKCFSNTTTNNNIAISVMFCRLLETDLSWNSSPVVWQCFATKADVCYRWIKKSRVARNDFFEKLYTIVKIMSVEYVLAFGSANKCWQPQLLVTSHHGCKHFPDKLWIFHLYDDLINTVERQSYRQESQINPLFWSLHFLRHLYTVCAQLSVSSWVTVRDVRHTPNSHRVVAVTICGSTAANRVMQGWQPGS